MLRYKVRATRAAQQGVLLANKSIYYKTFQCIRTMLDVGKYLLSVVPDLATMTSS